MKKVYGLLILALIIISACMIYIIKNGVSIRSAPYIKPSLITDAKEQIAENIFLRLYPELKETDYWVMGIGNSGEQIAILQRLKSLFEQQMQISVTLMPMDHFKSAHDLESCQTPCWVVGSYQDSSIMSNPNFFVSDFLAKNTLQTISFMEFDRQITAREQCLTEKRLTYECITEISVNEVRKKLKAPGRYFFARKYLDHDFFLFIEKNPSP